jgi:hypothetical protein
MSYLQYAYPTAWAIASTVAALWLLWVLYIISMGLYRAKMAKRLSSFAYCMGLPFLLLALALDAAINLSIACIFFAEPPQETLLTQRLQRHIAEGAGWRYHLAHWLCSHLLDPFDPTGSHCTKDKA